MKALRRIVLRARRTSNINESIRYIVYGILGVRQAAPVYSKDDKDSEWKRVAQDELGNTCKRHANRAQEIVVTTETNKSRWRHCASPAEQDEDGRGVWYQEADESEQCWITETFGQVATLRRCRRKEEAFVMLRTHRYRNLTAERQAIAGVVFYFDIFVLVGC